MRDKTNMDARYVPNGSTGGSALKDAGLEGGQENFGGQYGVSAKDLEKGFVSRGKFKAGSDPKNEA
jgi:hypothetical protein